MHDLTNKVHVSNIVLVVLFNYKSVAYMEGGACIENISLCLKVWGIRDLCPP